MQLHPNMPTNPVPHGHNQKYFSFYGIIHMIRVVFKLVVNTYYSANLAVSTQQHMGLYLLSCYLNIIRIGRVPAVKYIYFRVERGGLFGGIKTETPYITQTEGFIVALRTQRPVKPRSNHF